MGVRLMGRCIAGLFGSGVLLFASGALGLVGPWGLLAGVGFLTVGGVVFAIVADDRDDRAVAREPIAPTPALDPRS